jgi:signal transduction histidine kinase
VSRTLAIVSFVVAVVIAVAIMFGLWSVSVELERRQASTLADELQLALSRAASTYPVSFGPLNELRDELMKGDRDNLEGRFDEVLPDYADLQTTVARFLQERCPGMESRSIVKVVRATLVEEELFWDQNPGLGSTISKESGFVSAEHSLFLDANGLSVEVLFEAAAVNVNELLGTRRQSLRIGAVSLAVLLLISLGITLRAIVYSRTIGALQIELIDTLAHELHTPLTTLHIGLRTISDDLEPEKAEVVVCLQRQIHRLQRLTERVTASSRTLLHSAIPELAVYKPDEELETLLMDRFSESVQSGILQVSLNAPDATVLADRADLETLVGNLLENALKYGVLQVRNQVPPAHVVVSTRSEGKWFVVAVEDSGPGMRHKATRHLLRPFKRGRHATSGLGLGLYLCHRIARRMGGKMRIDSSQLGGVCARVKVPLFRKVSGR